MIFDCKLNSLNWLGQRYKDISLHHYIDDKEADFNFREPLQVPLCLFDQWYTVTVIEKENDTPAKVAFDEEVEGQNFGLPNLVYLDEQAGKVFISALDDNLVDRTFDVYINCHVRVNNTIQMPFNNTMEPFTIEVLGKPKPPFEQNTGPIVEDFLSSVFLEAGKTA